MLKRDLSWLWAAIAAMVVLVIWLLLQLGRQGSEAQIAAARSRAAVICQIMRAGAQRLGGTDAPSPSHSQTEAIERAVVDMALREDNGVEGGLWQPQRGVYAYAFPTYDGSGVKDDAPAAELQRIGSLAQRSLASAAPVVEVRPGLREAVVYGACPVADNVAGWTLTRVATMADNALDHLVVAVSVLLCALVLAGAWFAVLLTRWGREVQRLSGLLVASERMAALGSLAAGLAHEIRNPLGTIRMKVDNALAASPERRPARTEAALHTTLLQVQRLETLVASLLALTQPFHPQRAPVALADWLELRRQDHADAAADLQVTLALNLGAGLQAADNVALFDPAQMARVIDNLLINALAHTTAGGRVELGAARMGLGAACEGAAGMDVTSKPATMAVTNNNLGRQEISSIGTESNGPAQVADRLLLWVADDGRGVPPALQASLFDPLVTGRPGGTGLGLAVVREVIQAHGGTVALDPGHTPGTRIVMELPWT